MSQGLPGTNPASGQRGLELGISRFQVQHPDHSTTLPPCLLLMILSEKIIFTPFRMFIRVQQPFGPSIWSKREK